ncbi:hypothetical protein HYV49_05305 [Candidatus Pacearchaeota archaeon]|nr:hypothetical protein [Candidatus Pacearchaeota archaeon]
MDNEKYEMVMDHLKDEADKKEETEDHVNTLLEKLNATQEALYKRDKEIMDLKQKLNESEEDRKRLYRLAITDVVYPSSVIDQALAELAWRGQKEQKTAKKALNALDQLRSIITNQRKEIRIKNDFLEKL